MWTRHHESISFQIEGQYSDFLLPCQGGERRIYHFGLEAVPAEIVMETTSISLAPASSLRYTE